MSQFNKREVTYATLHGPCHLPGVGQFGPVLVKDLTKMRDIRMFLSDGFLQVLIKGAEILLPLSSVSHMQLAKEAPAKA